MKAVLKIQIMLLRSKAKNMYIWRSKFFNVGVILFSITCASCEGISGIEGASGVVGDQIEQPWKQDDSIARKWNEVLLQAIRNDYARPTVHARNLFHISAAMYDAWSIASNYGNPYLVGEPGIPECAFDRSGLVFSDPDVAISHAAARMIQKRFGMSPGQVETLSLVGLLATETYIDLTNYDKEWQNGSAAALGNYIADCYIAYGLQDGSNEANQYANQYYQQLNPNILPRYPGNPDIIDLNRWQAIELDIVIDQSGNIIETPEFLSPEWGQVLPFALNPADAAIYQRDYFDYKVYFDPGAPPYLAGVGDDDYKWGFSMVSIWSSHLDVKDGVMWDISPRSIGNNPALPDQFSNYDSFYNYMDGGDASRGHQLNPITGQPYEPQLVPRGDYARVLAEFWADGPDSETPPGHWFVILNSVSDHELITHQWKGEGESLSRLEWDIKSYFLMGGAMHDAAISAWGIKGWYDYIRPISAIRAMADLGQSTDAALPSYHPEGLPLVESYIELIEVGDPLAGDRNQHVGKVKLYTWRGPNYIGDPRTGMAGVGWIRAEDWWPYQRPSFVTPPFAGYISGHSTYSRAAAEVLTQMTGSEYFPGGMSDYKVEKNEFLVFEEGPSVDLHLQWATYRDASDQCSLSRIWGGIHPPADDIPGRIIGERIGKAAFTYAEGYF